MTETKESETTFKGGLRDYLLYFLIPEFLLFRNIFYLFIDMLYLMRHCHLTFPSFYKNGFSSLNIFKILVLVTCLLNATFGPSQRQLLWQAFILDYGSHFSVSLFLAENGFLK